MIDILVPVLGRPHRALPLVSSIAQHTSVSYTVTFVCSPNDKAEIEACLKAGVNPIVIERLPGSGDYAAKINLAFRRTYSPFVFCAADDVEFTPRWDTEILAEAERTGAGMVGCDDGANPLVRRGRHSTHSLFRRTYIDEVGATFFDGPGVVYHEGYEHQWVDTEAVKAAQDRGEWAFARRSLVRHHHPLYDKTAQMDDTYRKGLGGAAHDSGLFKQRLKAWSRRPRTTVL